MRCLGLKLFALVAVGVAAGFIHSRYRDVQHTLPANNTTVAAPTPADSRPAPVGPKPDAQPAAAAQAQAQADPKPQPPAAESDWYITLQRAKELHDSGGAIFIDARPYDYFREGHVTGAMHIDKKYFDGAAPKKVTQYLPGSAVVIYCGGGDCTDSEAVAKRLIALKRQIGPIYILKEGYPAWKDAGYPTSVGGEVGFET